MGLDVECGRDRRRDPRTLPALRVVLVSLGVMLEDFALVVAGTPVGLAGVALEILLGRAAIKGLGELFRPRQAAIDLRDLRGRRGLGLLMGIDLGRLNAGHLVGLGLVERLTFQQRSSQRVKALALAG